MDRDILEAMTLQQKQELAFQLIASLPLPQLAALHRSLTPRVQFDIIAHLPTELSLRIFSHLPAETLVICALVSKLWQKLTNDSSVWKTLCDARGWRMSMHRPNSSPFRSAMEDTDEEIGEYDSAVQDEVQEGQNPATTSPNYHQTTFLTPTKKVRKRTYKSLYKTHTRLLTRFLTSNYTLTPLVPSADGHTNTIYCVQLYTDPLTGIQSLYSGSRDASVREWNLQTHTMSRAFKREHNGSVLCLCAAQDLLISGGSDSKVVICSIRKWKVLGAIEDHADSVLGVKVEKDVLVTCSKDCTVRVYKLQVNALGDKAKLKFVLREHKAAVNAVAISNGLIVSGSGDRSVRLWDANTGELLRTYDFHHTRGIATIDFKAPVMVTGSSDKNLRLFDISTLGGWETEPPLERRHHDILPFPFPPSSSSPCSPSSSSTPCGCRTCMQRRARGRVGAGAGGEERDEGREEPEIIESHVDLVRCVAMTNDLVVSGSYDCTVKVWSRHTGELLANLANSENGHTRRVYGLAVDATKIVSCGEDQKICIWDFANGINTSFIQL